MIYGLYLSAAGVVANAHRQDVVANNIANSETAGFKRDLTLFMQRPTEAQSRAGGAGSNASVAGPIGGGSGAPGGAGPGPTNAVLEGLGGGLLVAPTATDLSQGELETTSNPMDLGLMGRGYFAVESNGRKYLTRAGNFTTDAGGNLILANGRHDRVLDAALKPITVDPAARFSVDTQGTVMQDGKPLTKLAVLDVPDAAARSLTKVGGDFFAHPDLAALRPAAGTRVEAGVLERSNAEPTLELSHLMDAQRALEANANMIRYQDQTLSRLVNDVGKIG